MTDPSRIYRLTDTADNRVRTQELNRILADVQGQVDTKQNVIAGAATTITDDDLTASRALASTSEGKVGVSSVTSTELAYVSGVTSAIQTQIDAKLAISATGGNTAWDDAHGAGFTRFSSTGLNNPSLVQINGGWWGYEFDNAAAPLQKQALADAQISHGVKQGSDYKFHLHFTIGAAPAVGANVVRFELQYATINNAHIIGVGGTGDISSAAALTTTTVDVTLPTTLSAYEECIVPLLTISNANMKPSSLYHVFIKRLSADAADTYASSIYAQAADGHVEYWRRGTAGEFA